MTKEYTHFFRDDYTTAWDKLVDWKISNRPKIENKLHTVVSLFFFWSIQKQTTKKTDSQNSGAGHKRK